MRLEHKDLPPFVQLLPKLIRIAFHSGTRFLASKGHHLIDIQEDRRLRDAFVHRCHQGYDSAQKRIVLLVLDIERRIREKKSLLKTLHRDTDRRREVEDLIHVLHDRQLILRRIADTILFSIVGEQEWVLRRLGKEQIRPVDPAVLHRMLSIASKRNQDNPLRFSLIADLTTVVHLGDLMEIEWHPVEGKSWHLIEVKEGKVNWKIREIIEDSSALTPLEKAEQILNTLGPHALKQSERMAKQAVRMAELSQILETDRGVDFKTGQEIVLSKEVIRPDTYEHEIATIVEGAVAQGVAGETIDSCLHLLAIRANLVPDRFSVSHTVYHMANPELPCGLLNTETLHAESQAVTSMRAPVIDLLDLTMRSQCGYPIFNCYSLSESRLLDLIEGRIRLFAQFDIERFIQMAHAKGITMSPITGKDAEKLKGISDEIPGYPGAWGIKVVKDHGSPQTLLVGFFSRPFLYFTRPSELLELAWELPGPGTSTEKT